VSTDLRTRLAGLTLDNTRPFGDRQAIRRAVETGQLPLVSPDATDEQIVAAVKETGR